MISSDDFKYSLLNPTKISSPYQNIFADINYEETLSTLRFADRAKSIKTQAIVNESATEKMIRELKEENEKLQSMIKKGGKEGGSQVSNLISWSLYFVVKIASFNPKIIHPHFYLTFFPSKCSMQMSHIPILCFVGT